jgi:hypothetical protein
MGYLLSTTMMLRLYFLVILASLAPLCAYAQEKKQLAQNEESSTQWSKGKDVIDILFRALHLRHAEAKRSKRRVNFSVMPVSTATSFGNKVLVSSINIAFTVGNRDSTNLSTVYLLPYTNLKQNIGVGTKVIIWTADNGWNFPAEFRISSLAQYTYGLGTSSTQADQIQLNYKNVRTYFSANRRIFDHFFSGLGFNFDRYYEITESGSATTPSAFEKYGIGTSSTSLSSGMTINFLHDSRQNSINASHSLYYSIVYRFNPYFMRNTTQWTSLYTDVRKYIPFTSEKRKILALWGIYWAAYGKVPYLNLPGTQLEFGGRSGRGFAQGRFRGKQMLYFESEYRFDITNNKLLGGVLFANAQSLSEPNTNRFQYIAPAAGFGARIKFNSKSDTNLTLDFGFGKNSFNFYIGLGEFF